VSILPGTPWTESDRQPAALTLHNVRPVERPATPVPAGTVHPVLAEIARTKPGYTTATIDGRPVQVFIERDRLHWWKLGGLVAAIAGPVVGVVAVAAYATGSAVSWTADHWPLIAGALGVAALVVLTLRGLFRAGICCPGLHCSGCPHR
jgi:hypothetical protein